MSDAVCGTEDSKKNRTPFLSPNPYLWLRVLTDNEAKTQQCD